MTECVPRLYRPSWPLRQYVRYYWFMDSTLSLSALTFPVGCPQIIFHFKSPLYIPELDVSQASFTISGQVNFPTHLETSGELRMMVAVFHPNVMPAVLRIPFSELYNMEIPGDSLGDESLNELANRIFDADSDSMCIKRFEIWLVDRISQSYRDYDIMRIGASLRCLMENPGISVAELSSVACLGKKQFYRVFYSTVGMPPKEYASVVRFQKSLWYMQCGNTDFADVAVASGYADQSHFIRECRRFSGKTPLALLKNGQVYSEMFNVPVL